jgi:hypothetical protein
MIAGAGGRCFGWTDAKPPGPRQLNKGEERRFCVLVPALGCGVAFLWRLGGWASGLIPPVSVLRPVFWRLVLLLRSGLSGGLSSCAPGRTSFVLCLAAGVWSVTGASWRGVWRLADLSVLFLSFVLACLLARWLLAISSLCGVPFLSSGARVRFRRPLGRGASGGLRRPPGSVGCFCDCWSGRPDDLLCWGPLFSSQFYPLSLRRQGPLRKIYEEAAALTQNRDPGGRRQPHVFFRVSSHGPRSSGGFIFGAWCRSATVSL